MWTEGLERLVTGLTQHHRGQRRPAKRTIAWGVQTPHHACIRHAKLRAPPLHRPPPPPLPTQGRRVPKPRSGGERVTHAMSASELQTSEAACGNAHRGIQSGRERRLAATEPRAEAPQTAVHIRETWRGEGRSPVAERRQGVEGGGRYGEHEYVASVEESMLVTELWIASKCSEPSKSGVRRLAQ